jgi:hypothetical protein
MTQGNTEDFYLLFMATNHSYANYILVIGRSTSWTRETPWPAFPLQSEKFRKRSR